MHRHYPVHNAFLLASTLSLTAVPVLSYVSRALSCGIWQDTHFAPPHKKNVWIGRRARNVLLPFHIQFTLLYHPYNFVSIYFPIFSAIITPHFRRYIQKRNISVRNRKTSYIRGVFLEGISVPVPGTERSSGLNSIFIQSPINPSVQILAPYVAPSIRLERGKARRLKQSVYSRFTTRENLLQIRDRVQFNTTFTHDRYLLS